MVLLSFHANFGSNSIQRIMLKRHSCQSLLTLDCKPPRGLGRIDRGLQKMGRKNAGGPGVRIGLAWALQRRNDT